MGVVKVGNYGNVRDACAYLSVMIRENVVPS